MKAIVTILGSATALTTLLDNGANSIYPDEAPQGDGVPHVIVDVADIEPIDTMSTTVLDEYQIRVFCVSNRAYTSGTNVGAEEVANQVRTALDGYSGTVGSEVIGKAIYESGDRYQERHGGNKRVVCERIFQVFKRI